MSENHLKIRARSLDLDLVGEAEYIVQAYDAIRGVLIERYRASIEGATVGAHAEERADAGRRESAARISRSTMRLDEVSPHETTDGLPSQVHAGPQHVNVVMCNEVYNKICLVERDDMRRSIFDRALALDHVHRIYINRSQQERFQGHFNLGKVLWRELTSAGKAAVKRGG